MRRLSWGYLYEKDGSLKQVSAPVTSDLKPVKKKSKTKTGKIPASVGFSGYKSTPQ